MRPKRKILNLFRSGGGVGGGRQTKPHGDRVVWLNGRRRVRGVGGGSWIGFIPNIWANVIAGFV